MARRAEKTSRFFISIFRSIHYRIDPNDTLSEKLLTTRFGLQFSEHRVQVKISTSHKATVLGHVPPKLLRVFNNVMYVPPDRGSLILAKNAIFDTNMQ